MKEIKILLTDIDYTFVENMLNWISEHFKLNFDETNPDFIIHSCFGHEVLKYNGVKIFWTGENLQPDFNISDYAIGFGRLNFGDRYIRIPLYRWCLKEYEQLFDQQRKLINKDGNLLLKEKSTFCTMVMSYGKRGDYFNELYKKLTNYKKVDSGGRWNNNVGGPVKEKLPFICKGKFHLAFENSSSPGYITEKIMQGFVAKTVPIYWGAPDVKLDFNPRSFINCHDYKSIDEVVENIIELDNDNELYKKMLEEPCFIDGKEPLWLSKEVILEWLIHIFNQPLHKAYRRNLDYFGEKYQNQLLKAFHMPHKQFLENNYLRIRKRINKLIY